MFYRESIYFDNSNDTTKKNELNENSLIKSSFEPDSIFYSENLDTQWVEYKIKPGQTLSLIAYELFGNPNEWRRIYGYNYGNGYKNKN